MKTVGLITEYNPFHNGHKYHIEQAKKLSGADNVIVIMSGDYVQRGTPAIMPKRLRAEMALEAGASAVFELPVCYSTASAELFALGSVSFLDQLGIVDYLCFGSECNDINKLKTVADFLSDEPYEYKDELQKHLKKGVSFPVAREAALSKCLNDPEIISVVKDPNNILGIEYLKALNKIKSNIIPISIKRITSNYHDKTLKKGISSATAIRSLLNYSVSTVSTVDLDDEYENTAFSSILDKLEDQVPDECLSILKDYHHISYPVYQNDFSILMKYKLLNKTPEALIKYMDISPDFANRICNNLNNFFNYKQFCEFLKTKEMTQTRINRGLLHIMLGIKTSNVTSYINGGYHYYARLLGVRKDKNKLLGSISQNSSLPLITSLYKLDEIPKIGQDMLYQDVLASNLYTSVITDKYKTPFKNEYNQPIIKV